MVLNVDSSPFQSSPFNPSEGNSSPRLFWQGRDPSTPNRFNSENNIFGGRESSPSPTRRSSIERLQRASRVKNSNMFAREQKQEYDPTSVPVIERPLAKHVQGNAYGGAGLEGLRSAEKARPFGHHKNDSKSSIPLYSPFNSPTKTPLKSSVNGLRSPSKDQISPTKSSMASRSFNSKASFDVENGTWSEDNSCDERELPPGRALHRHAKSVTFDAAPPQVNEYEMTTPDLSSIGNSSRENSYDSAEEDEDGEEYDRGESVEHDDSFDASLEDTDKTPVVGPEDWRHASPGSHNTGIISGRLEDPFEGPEGSPMPDARPMSSSNRPTGTRTDSLNSNGDHRPLPPLPGMSSFASSNGISATAERASSAQRNLPSPPAPATVSKSEIQGMSGGKMSLEERLRLMMVQDDDKPKTAAEQQRERRLRRGAPRGERHSQTPEREQISVHEDEDTLDDLPGLGNFQLPSRISRESILRKVNGHETLSRDSDYNFSSPMPSSSPERAGTIDPDIPLPSTEDQSVLEDGDDSIIIKPEPDDDVDVYSIPDLYQPSTESGMDDYDSATQDGTGDADMESQYSDPTPSLQSPQLQSSVPEDEGPPTPRANLDSDPVKQKKNSLPEFTGFMSDSDFGSSFQSYMTPSPDLPTGTESTEELRGPSMSAARDFLARPETPKERPLPSLKPEYDGTGWGSDEEDVSEVGTPDSVIRHPVSPTPARDSPAIPEHVATIKSSGSKLKTRPSATPSDLMAMKEMRRQVSAETRNIPPIPERHRNRPSMSADRELGESESPGGVARKQSLKRKSLTLDIGSDLGLSLDADFDRVIEAQKVAFSLSSSPSAYFKIQGQASDLQNLPLSESFANITPRKQRGYLMRQNTKVVVASSDHDKGTRSAGNSPVKKDRPESWTVEPWNGKMRKNSVRDRSSPRKRTPTGPMPPMPGQESNVAGLGIRIDEVPEPVELDGGERGRLFVKVMGVKDLDLPLPKGK
jgi:hypothetical protein